MLSGLAIPYKSHHRKGHRNGHKHEVQHDSHKSHTNHHSKHRTATGDLRESVPTPLQDFVLVSGSPLFHERPTKDQKVSQEHQVQEHAANQTAVNKEGQVLAVPLSIQAAEANQPLKQEQKQPGGLSTNSTSTTSRPILEQVHGNSAQQNLPPTLKTAFKPPKEFAIAGLNKGGEQEKEATGGTNSEPTLLLTSQAPKNFSLGTQAGSNAQGNTSLSNNVDQSQTFHGANTSLALGGIVIGEQKVNGPKKNQTNTTNTDDEKPIQGQQQAAGHFPFHILLGMRNYGNGTSENKGAQQMTDKEKFGLGENLGPNCHWKTTMGEKGNLVTSVSCFGEFKKPDGNKAGMDKTGSTSVSETAGNEQEKHEQSKCNNNPSMMKRFL